MAQVHFDDFKRLPGDARLTTFPISRTQLFKYYKDATFLYWTIEEINVSEDRAQYPKLPRGIQHFIKYILAFFAASDGIINLNLIERFRKEVGMLEATYFYDFQVMMENVHANTYSMLLDAIIPSATERDELLNAIQTMPIIARISKFMFDCIGSDASLAERLLRMACIEGILFTGCFCAIYWLQGRGLMPALAHSNELIARDEALHTMFSMFLYTMIEQNRQLSPSEIRAVVKEAVDIAIEFIKEALPEPLPEMNAELMADYIRCQADNLVSLIGMAPIYNSKHEFKFMEQQNMINRTNFFERRVSEYSKPLHADTGAFDVADDF